MMGPLHSYRDSEHLASLIEAINFEGIRVEPFVEDTRRHGFNLKRGRAVVTASIGSGEWDSMLYLGFGHPFNPLLWRADSRLLCSVERILIAGGTRKMVLEDSEAATSPNKCTANKTWVDNPLPAASRRLNTDENPLP